LFITKGSFPGKASHILELTGQGSLAIPLGYYSLKIPWVIILWILIILATYCVLKRTSIGFILYGTAANDRAAELFGIKTEFVRVLAYAMSGTLSAIAGLLMLGFVKYPNITLGQKYVLPSVVAVIMGGIDFGGGSGSYLGAVAGAIFLTTLASILTTLNIPEGGRDLVTGIVLVILLLACTRKSAK
jgi:ribose transport system permease protein